ncbi:MAG: hypothetical protein KGJ09_04850 [Candidatus Omnitrophica bacterium]|nr:hypothetical protein [Candidatus Omnitrophota bacterium]MDE2009391.1 hypothetical protein [Candidatus Omnitrophota bacterium]MDE2214175.1 hypothetical protein [Candidatus Omnitrophota bacterium]MDE2231212.1 hypothetical protein [Candidatus Omnitrophota bacterium]
MKVFKTKISKLDLEELAKTYGDMIKGVVDIGQKMAALGGELHADCEEVLLEQGCKQADLWGFNIYPNKKTEERLEYTSFINIRPKQGNFQMEVKDEKIRRQIKAVVDHLID